MKKMYILKEEERKNMIAILVGSFLGAFLAKMERHNNSRKEIRMM